MSHFTQAVRQIVGDQNFFENKADRIAAATWPCMDTAACVEALPQAVARPAHVRQLAEITRLCAEEHISLRIRGSGTGMLHQPLTQDCLLVQMTGLNRVLEIEKSARIAYVQAGVTGRELARSLGDAGMFFPGLAPMPQSTLGGMLSRNEAGPEYSKYGSPASYLYDLELIGGNGELLTFGALNNLPWCLRHLPLAQLFCGTLGTLGIIASARLKLLPLPCRVGLLIAFRDMEDCASACADLLAAEFLPAALEILDGKALEFFDQGDMAAAIYLEAHGQECGITQMLDKTREMMKAHAPLDCLEIQPDNFWPIFRTLPFALYQEIANPQTKIMVFPPNRLQATLEAINNLASQHSTPVAIFGDAACARLYLIHPATAQDFQKDLTTLEQVLNNTLDSDNAWQERDKAFKKTLADFFDPGGILS